MAFSKGLVGPNQETDWPVMIQGDVRLAASADPYAGTTADNGKPIWDVDTINANLNRTEWDWYTNNYGELDDGVLNYGFWTYDELAESYYVNSDGSIAFNEAYYEAYFSEFTPVQVAMADEAIGLWDDLVAISFEQTAVTEADLTYGNTYTGGAQAYAYLPFGDVYDPIYNYYYGFEEIGRLSGDVWVDGFVGSNFFPAGDSWYSMATMVHETGHALGLSHPGDYDALDDNDGIPGPDPITYANDAAFFQDSLQYTVMSYFDAYETGAQHIDWELASFGYASTPLIHDVSAIQEIYGADTTTRLGDTTYGFNSNAGRTAFDFSANRVPIVTIWDAGGNDTLDLSGYNTPSTIDLHAGAFSSAGGIEEFLTREEVNANRAAIGLGPRSEAQWAFYEGIKAQYGLENGLFTDNISIAYGVTIENAVGGGGDDLIFGNDVANRLSGGGGDDVLVGFDGFDVLKGGLGNDEYVASINSGKLASKMGSLSVDAIVDFARGSDKIDLTGIDAKTGGSHDAFSFIGTNNGKNAGQLFYKSYNSVTGAENALGIDIDGTAGASPYAGKVTVVFGNVDGGSADFALVLFGVSSVSADDFIFVDDTAFGGAEAAAFAMPSSQPEYLVAPPVMF